MTSTAEPAAHPVPPASVAFFDVDDTILNSKSLLDFLEYVCTSGCFGSVEANRELRRFLYQELERGTPRAVLNRHYYRSVLAGQKVSTVLAAARRWYVEAEQRADFYNHGVLREIEKHRLVGRSIVLVTGSFGELLVPLFERLGLDRNHAILAPLVVVDGLYTGELASEPTIGMEKANRIRALAKLRGIELGSCYAYSDDLSDLPMLDLVGFPYLVNPRADATNVCRERGWNTFVDTREA